MSDSLHYEIETDEAKVATLLRDMAAELESGRISLLMSRNWIEVEYSDQREPLAFRANLRLEPAKDAKG